MSVAMKDEVDGADCGYGLEICSGSWDTAVVWSGIALLCFKKIPECG